MRLRSILILLAILLALGGYFYFSNRPKPAPPVKVHAWSIEMDEIQHVVIKLPREGKSQAFIKIPEGDKFPWHFDDPQSSAVDEKQWETGIPVLLSGADIVIAENATEEKLAEFGLTQPLMQITLTLENGNIMNITVGDRTPNGKNFYVQVPGSNDICLVVNYIWYEALENLVKESSSASTSAK